MQIGSFFFKSSIFELLDYLLLEPAIIPNLAHKHGMGTKQWTGQWDYIWKPNQRLNRDSNLDDQHSLKKIIKKSPTKKSHPHEYSNKKKIYLTIPIELQKKKSVESRCHDSTQLLLLI